MSFTSFSSVILHSSLDTFSLALKRLFIFSWVLHLLVGCVTISSILQCFDYPLSEEIGYKIDVKYASPFTEGPNKLPSVQSFSWSSGSLGNLGL